MTSEIFVPVGADYEGICRLCRSTPARNKRIIKLGPTVIEKDVAQLALPLLAVFRCPQGQTRIEKIAEDLISKAIKYAIMNLVAEKLATESGGLSS
jgi:hypothetical protein